MNFIFFILTVGDGGHGRWVHWCLQGRCLLPDLEAADEGPQDDLGSGGQCCP